LEDSVPEIAYVNGLWGPIAEAMVNIEDRGFQFGDGVYEVIIAYEGKPFLIEQHLSRLRQSAAAIDLRYDFGAHPVTPVILEGLRRADFSSAMVYVQLTRGVAPRNHIIPPDISPTLVITVKPLPKIPDDRRVAGFKLTSTAETRWANCYVKAVTLLPNVLAKNEALRRGFDDAVFVAGDLIRECTSSNIFMIKDGKLLFPPRNESVLHGITQGFIAECAIGIDIIVCEEPITIEQLYAADEVFVSSTLMEVMPVTSIDGRRIGDGRMGMVTNKLFQEFRRRARR
jgi:D-alanine transaminase